MDNKKKIIILLLGIVYVLLLLLTIKVSEKKVSESDINVESQIEVEKSKDEDFISKYKDGIDVETNLIEETTESELKEEAIEESIEVKEEIIEEVVELETEESFEVIEEEVFMDIEIVEETEEELTILEYPEVESSVKGQMNVVDFILPVLSKGYEDEEGILNMDIYNKDILINTYDEYLGVMDELNDYKLDYDEESLIKLNEYFSKYNKEFFNNNSLYIYSDANSCTVLNKDTYNVNYDMFTGLYDYEYTYSYNMDTVINGFNQIFFLAEVSKDLTDSLGKIEFNIVSK